nr:MAG TPA: hypothetical protein [Caudoviricetes sp.]
MSVCNNTVVDCSRLPELLPGCGSDPVFVTAL